MKRDTTVQSCTASLHIHSQSDKLSEQSSRIALCCLELLASQLILCILFYSGLILVGLVFPEIPFTEVRVEDEGAQKFGCYSGY